MSTRVKPAPKSKGTPLTKKERAAHNSELAEKNRLDKEAIARKAKAAGMRKIQVRAPNGEVREVWSFRSSLQFMKLEDRHREAAERFARDWETAYRGLRSQSLEPKVDGGAAGHSAHIQRIRAQDRIAASKRYIGQRLFEIVVCVVVYGGSARGLHAIGGKQHVIAASDIEVALNQLDAFYSDGNSIRKDATWAAAERFNRERAELIALAEQELG